MSAIAFILLSLLSSRVTPLELASEIYLLLENGSFTEAFPLITELYERMPHNEEILYNYSATLMNAGEYALADSLLENADFMEIQPEYTASARTSASLAHGILNEDYSSVEEVSEELKDMIVSGEYLKCDLHNLEAALNWLDNHEPPPDDQQDNDEQNEDDNQEDGDGQDGKENSDNEQDAGEEENDDDSQADEEENEPQEDEEQSEPERQPPPSIDEMTEEQAQAILDMLSEPPAEEDEKGVTGISGVGDI